jgi:glycogen debranching enzyme
VGFDSRDPHQIAFRDWSVLLCHPDGAIGDDRGCGLYFEDCRILSRYRLSAGTRDTDELEPTNSWPIESDHWFGEMRILRRGDSPDGPRLPQDAIEIRIERLVGQGMLEHLTVVNHSMAENALDLRIELAADFADTLEVAQRNRQQTGTTTVTRRGNSAEVRYAAQRGTRRTERGLRVSAADGGLALDVSDEAVLLSADLRLAPRETWRTSLVYQPLRDGRWLRPVALTTAWQRAIDQRNVWRAWRPRVTSSNGSLETTARVAADDLYALRNRELEHVAGEGWVVNAGVPIFTGLFGRDCLTAGWQAALLGPQFMTGALGATARLQADADDPWRDSEPGKLIHELRRGPLADLHMTAQSGYYGTQTTAAMFPLVLSERWHWTGDTREFAAHRETVAKTLEWARRDGDLDGDGFLEYRQRSPVGIKNQGWKDSHEAIRYPDGRNVENPIATVEEQAFHYLALCRAAEMCVVLDDDATAQRYIDRARRLRDRWHDAFWLEDERFYAMALDPAKERVASIGSNAGHALAAGIVPVEFASFVVERLMADDMYSGWGVRTLSSLHPSFNPWAYHLGTVWPVEQATFALGFKRYGFDQQADRLIGGMLQAAAVLPGTRLPELLGGQSRSDVPFPIVYPDANAPQAWSASATLQLLQISLGMYPFAALRTLALVRPRLPAGIEQLTIANLRVGRARVTLRFTRQPDGSAAHEVVERHGALLVVEAPPPDAAGQSDLRDALTMALVAHAPGKLARAARLALGVID